MFTLQAAVTLVLVPVVSLLPFVASTGTIVCTNEIVDFNLIDTSASPPTFTELTPVVDLSDFSSCKLNIEATIDSTPSNCDEQTVKCVQFFFDGILVRKEKFAPFTLYGDVTGGAINSRMPQLGKHTVKACTYSDKACTKNEMGCKEMGVDFLHCNRTPVRSPVIKVPIRPPVQATIQPLAPVNTGLNMACNFLNTPDITACRKIKQFFGNTNGTTIPSELGVLTQLTYLSLWKNQLTGTIPSTLGLLTQLTTLILSDNQLTGTIPSTLGQLTRLNELILLTNQLTGTIPSIVGQLTKLITLAFYENTLRGTIPSSLGQLTQLSYLGLWDNQLTGTIPSTLGQLKQLTQWYMYNNRLTGTIPSTLGQLKEVYLLELHSNQLSGSIPSTLGLLTQLNYLELSDNQLTGTIPSTLGQMTQLGILALSSNQLTGTVPSTLGQLTQLYYMSLQDNAELAGFIPSTLCSTSATIGIDCANIVCTCCKEAFEGPRCLV